MAKELLIKNACVYDPLNGIEGEVMDIGVKDGKIVDPSEVDESKAKVIDAEGRLTMAGGVDIHAHVAGPKVNVGRIFRPEDSRRLQVAIKKLGTRSGTGFSVPSTTITGYLYAQMGYTTVMEAATPPLLTRHTHEEIRDTPILDEGAYTLMANNWILYEYIKEGELEKAAAYAAWLLRATKGFVIKMVNPGGTEAWGWGENVHSLDDPVPYFEITPAEIYQNYVKINEMLGLPHSIHIHPNLLGEPGNYEITTDSWDVIKKTGVEPNPEIGEREQVVHNTHVQFHSYGGDSWPTFESKAEEVAKYLNKNDHVTVDLGAVTLDETTTMTADGPLEWELQELTGFKWANYDVELETGSGVVPFIYSPKNPVHSVQWAIGLEIALLTENPWQVVISTDHPNAGPFIRYPRIIAWLMSEPYREEWIENVHPWVGQRAAIATIDREYTWTDITITTRAAPAKMLGLSDRIGHLGEGAYAHIAIYDIKPDEVDPSRDYEEVEKAMEQAWLVVKDGEIVVQEGVVVNEPVGRTYWVDVKVPEDLLEEVKKDLETKFRRYYSVNLGNYQVQDVYIPKEERIVIDARDRLS
ncbi:formylmethanofuran dehydrogenase subunit A [Methanopyrus kandleri]|uniref:Formylmethanofuran dehydrogenase subunit A n=2 Tax=Methanopyrus kandleri TaxID=2320 RepID=Q8TV69_METKA|nr:formylmethanofuran dehydrogenase subunit A [Methanopyrus kandleri]AAM02742.1 Formylmethanofuran dehydrogenase subunit A [Methanopyrus kandleri AV19]HII71002.1 formylmethanofuran dehydrogenase subunit A [Methanopyrus kandleri]